MNNTPPPGALPLTEASIDRDEGFPADKNGLSHPYWDEIGRVWTIGTGLTRLNGKPVTATTTAITRAQNDAAVGLELVATANLIASIVHVPLSACQWAALANWMYNVGGHAAANSTLIKELNTGNYTGACQQFAVWNESNGRIIPGLVDRRARTMALFSGQAVPGVTDQVNGSAVASMPINQTLHAGSNTVAKPLSTSTPVVDAQPTADELDDQYNQLNLAGI